SSSGTLLLCHASLAIAAGSCPEGPATCLADAGGYEQQLATAEMANSARGRDGSMSFRSCRGVGLRPNGGVLARQRAHRCHERLRMSEMGHHSPKSRGT